MVRSALVGPDAAIAAVRALAARPGPLFVGIDGPGGAGKSTLAALIRAAVPGSAVVAVDDFSGASFEEWDWERFGREVVRPLSAGSPARYQVWDWDSDRPGPWSDVPAGSLVIVEGVSSTRDEVDVRWALRIWVDAPAVLRRERALARDGAEVFERMWQRRWIPSEQRYIAAQHPRERADLIVDGTS